MDLTLSANQVKAVESFIDATIGEEPSKSDHGTAAEKRREARAQTREWLTRFSGLSMRIGAERRNAELGLPHKESAMPVWKMPNGDERILRPIPDGKEGGIIVP